MRSKNDSNLKHLCLSKNEKRWQTKQEKMIKAHNGARSHALNHSLEWPETLSSLFSLNETNQYKVLSRESIDFD